MNTEKEIIVLMGSSEYHERLTFTKPAPAETVLAINFYCDELVNRAGNPAEDEDIKASAYLIVDGIRTDLTDSQAFLASAGKLSDAESFELDVRLDAHYRSAVYNAHPEDDEEGDGTGEIVTFFSDGLLNHLSSLENVDGFEYKHIAFYPNSGEFGYFKIKDSKRIDIDGMANKEFPLAIKDTAPWYSYNMGLSYNLDSITDEQAEKVHEIVKRYVPESEIEYCSDYWEDDNSIILGCIQWTPENFTKVAEFLAELNAAVENPALESYMPTAAATSFNAWFDMENFGIIFMDETDGKFSLLGTDF